MTEVVQPKPGNRALEIGTGSGYAAAVLATIVSDVYTVERLERLAKASERRLADLGYRNVHVLHGDGTLGWPEHAPYEAIIVTARTRASRRRCSINSPSVAAGHAGRPDAPVQRLLRVTRRALDDYAQEDLEAVAFVPLIGEQGWPTRDLGDVRIRVGRAPRPGRCHARYATDGRRAPPGSRPTSAPGRPAPAARQGPRPGSRRCPGPASPRYLPPLPRRRSAPSASPHPHRRPSAGAGLEMCPPPVTALGNVAFAGQRLRQDRGNAGRTRPEERRRFDGPGFLCLLIGASAFLCRELGCFRANTCIGNARRNIDIAERHKAC